MVINEEYIDRSINTTIDIVKNAHYRILYNYSEKHKKWKAEIELIFSIEKDLFSHINKSFQFLVPSYVAVGHPNEKYEFYLLPVFVKSGLVDMGDSYYMRSVCNTYSKDRKLLERRTERAVKMFKDYFDDNFVEYAKEHFHRIPSDIQETRDFSKTQNLDLSIDTKASVFWSPQVSADYRYTVDIRTRAKSHSSKLLSAMYEHIREYVLNHNNKWGITKVLETDCIPQRMLDGNYIMEMSISHPLSDSFSKEDIIDAQKKCLEDITNIYDSFVKKIIHSKEVEI